MSEHAILLLARMLLLQHIVVYESSGASSTRTGRRCVRGRNGPCVVLSIVTRELRGARQGCRRKEGKLRNKAVAPVTHERAPERTRRIISARGVLLVAHKSACSAEMNVRTRFSVFCEGEKGTERFRAFEKDASPELSSFRKGSSLSDR